ncbi:MAG TPA: T9SS type A sorting domain-containing protein [Bacteroidales bacterium]|nr:T9SS type A sorting domain-containing protein [Bacteroidales bacterium]
MKKSLRYFVLAGLFVFCTGFAFGQCTPDPNVTDPEGNGEMVPDTIEVTELSPANLTVTIICPDTAHVPGMGFIYLHHITVKNLQNKPSWLNAVCGCTNWELPVNQSKCVLVTGTPPTGSAGYHVIDVIVDVYALIGGVPVQVATDYNSGMPLVVLVHPEGYDVAEFEYQGFGIIPAQPNPFNSTTKFGCFTERPQTVSLRVFDMVGKEVFSENVNTQAGENYFTFDGNHLNDGVYFYSITDEQNRVITKKFIKSR